LDLPGGAKVASDTRWIGLAWPIVDYATTPAARHSATLTFWGTAPQRSGCPREPAPAHSLTG
ncbi:MAG TPA: hypothetical protein VNM48_08980, partial [Chloroflexota bacterium]|nr:hypothetical protein [Chloroflexota bacterium]